MSRLTWIETLDGWISGHNQIELAGPRLWVLSRRQRRAETVGLVRAELVETAGSLRELKRVAEDLEGARLRRRRLVAHVGIMLLLVAGTVIGSATDWNLTVPAVAAIFCIALRTMVLWVDQATGSAWSKISHTYQ
jgi:hypothetical protein